MKAEITVEQIIRDAFRAGFCASIDTTTATEMVLLEHPYNWTFHPQEVHDLESQAWDAYRQAAPDSCASCGHDRKLHNTEGVGECYGKILDGLAICQCSQFASRSDNHDGEPLHAASAGEPVLILDDNGKFVGNDARIDCVTRIRAAIDEMLAEDEPDVMAALETIRTECDDLFGLLIGTILREAERLRRARLVSDRTQEKS